MIYVYRCEACEREIERPFKMGEAPDHILSDCDWTGKRQVKCNRVYLPLQHSWKDTRPHAEAIVEGARAIKNSGKYDIETTIT